MALKTLYTKQKHVAVCRKSNEIKTETHLKTPWRHRLTDSFASKPSIDSPPKISSSVNGPDSSSSSSNMSAE